MKIGELYPHQRYDLAANNAFLFNAGPFAIRLHSDIPDFVDLLSRMYPAVEQLELPAIADFHVAVQRPTNLRRWCRPQAIFKIDGQVPFEPYPLDQAFPLFEWGLNFCIATRAHQYCMLHAAVVARGDTAVIMPAMPGSGKSTLCAALIHRGWDLLSDEFGLVDPESATLVPLPRAIPLKNESIDVIRAFASDATIGPRFEGTRKGTVAHVSPGRRVAAGSNIRACWIIFPKYLSGSSMALDPVPKSQAFLRLANNSFNYHLLGETSYRALIRLVTGADSYSFKYSDLDEAVDLFDRLHQGREGST